MKCKSRTMSVIILLFIVVIMSGCTKGKKYETVEQMRNDLVGTYRIEDSDEFIIITNDKITRFNYDSVFKKASTDNDSTFDNLYNDNFSEIDLNNFNIDDLLKLDHTKITVSDASYDISKSQVNDIFVDSIGTVLTSKKNGKTLTKLSQDTEFPTEDMLLQFAEYKLYLSNYEFLQIKKEAEKNYNKILEEVKECLSKSTPKTSSRSMASDETIAQCAWQQLKENLKDPYTAHLFGYADVEKDSYGRVFCKLVYEAKNGFGNYVTETKYVVLTSCTYSGRYTYSPYLFCDSNAYSVKTMNNWDKDPDGSDEKENDYKKILNFIENGNYNSAVSYLTKSLDYKNNRDLYAVCNKIIKAKNYLEGINLFADGKYDQVKTKLKSISDYLKAKRLIELCDSEKNLSIYKIAIEEFNAGNYEEAKSRFTVLGDYSDSKKMAEECTEKMYEAALNLVNIGSYTDALKALQKLGDYKDVKELIEICNNGKADEQYNKAMALYNEEKYSEAKTAFIAMNGYRESDKYVELCNTGIKQKRYDEAVALYNQSKYEEARVIFSELTDFSDSMDYIDLCDNGILQKCYDEAVVLYNSGKYYEAKNVFQSLKDFGDSKAYITKCEDGIKDNEYKTAVELYNKGEFENAKTAFLKLNGYSESNKYIDLCNTGINKKRYDEAVALYNKGKYDEAKVIFVSLGNYNESQSYVDKCNNATKEQAYQSAISLYNSGKYDKAKAAFQELNGYSDSKAYIIKCENAIKEKEYQSAIALYNSGNYEKAKTAFASLGNYSDSKAYITRCENGIKEREYQSAIALYNSGNYEKAKTAFANLGNYSDSKAYITRCENAIKERKYQSALALYNSAEYVKAQAAFSALEDYSDSKAYVEKCKDKQYNQAMTMYKHAVREEYDYIGYINRTELKEARSIFESLGSFKDSKKYADYCSYRIVYNFEKDKKYDGWTITIYDIEEAPDSWKKTDNWIYPSEIDGKKVTTIGKHCTLYSQFLKDHPSIKSETFPDTIKCIGSHAFEYCNVEKIYLPSSVEEIDPWGLRVASHNVNTCKSNFYFNTTDLDKLTGGNKNYFQVGGNVYYRGADGEWVYYTGLSEWYPTSY